jgi:predicted transcriptional regulator
MTFLKKYDDKVFLSVLSTDKPQTTSFIAKQTGAGRNTAIRFLKDLEKAGRVKRVDIEGGFHAWIKVEPVKKNDIENFRSYVKKYLEQHPESEIAKKVLQSLKE